MFFLDLEGEDDHFRNERFRIVQRFEAMLSEGSVLYFELSDMEDVIDFYLRIADTDKAWRALNFALLQHSNNSELELRRAIIYCFKGQLERSLKIINKLECKIPTNTNMLTTKAYLLREFGKHAQALHYLKRALKTAEHSAELHFQVSCAYKTLSNYSKALAQLKIGLKKMPDSHLLMLRIGYLYSEMKAYDAAINYFKRFLDDYPYNSLAWHNLGSIYTQIGKYEKAVWACELSIAIDDENYLAMEVNGKALIQLEEFDKAEEQFNELLELEPDNLAGLIGIAECYEGREEIEEAFDKYAYTANTYAYCADAWYGMAVVREKQGRLFECMPYIENAIAADSNKAEYWAFLADLEEYLGQYDQALEAIEHACKIDPEDESLHASKALIIFKYFDRKQGTETLMESLKILPESAELHYHQSAFLLSLGQVSEALHFLQNGLELNYNKHLLLFEQYPEAIYIPRVMDLIQIYGQ